VANGDIGLVEAVVGRTMNVRLADPGRRVQAPLPAAPDPASPDEDGSSDGSGGAAAGFDLAYAVSGHKAQGSQWPYVVILADPGPRACRVASRNWWYTSLSRAGKLCVVVGQKATVDWQCRVNALARNTCLAELLRLPAAPQGSGAAGGVSP
jgi:exodeoxyribonuclease V alpha subunit